MATSSLSSEPFKMPSEPCPLPSLGSDEESFVVLWNDMDSKSTVELNHEPVGTSVVEEAKQLINNELTEIEKLSLAEKAETQPENNLAVDGPSSVNDKKVTEDSQIDKSTVFPKMPQVEKGFDTSDVISITTLSTDLTSEQVQNKVSEIVEENIRLKDTILQNNMSMKSQYERIVAWQEDVQKVHQAHKEKIIEAKEFIERLKKENYNLTRELEQAEASKKALEQEILSLKQTQEAKKETLLQSTDDNLKQFELEVVNKKVRDLELTLKTVTEENATLKENTAKLAKAESIIDKCEKEIRMLLSERHFQECEVKEAKREVMQAKIAEEEKLQSLNEVIDTLRTQLFYNKHQNTALPTVEEVANIRQQLAKTQIVLTQVEQARVTAFTQVESLNKEILDLRARLEQSEAHVDEIYALKAQLDVYKADFEAERSAKETIKTEKEKLAEDMQNLQRRNQQLQEEIDLIREHDYVVPPSQRSRQSSSPSAPSVASNGHPMKCPVCNFGFKTQQALENHVYRCIELDDRLP